MKIDLHQPLETNEYFKWYEVLFLPQWNIYAFPSQEQYENILNFAETLRKVRLYLGRPMIPTSFLRPKVYNQKIGGAKNSAHILGRAIDFYCKGQDIEETKKLLLPVLDGFNLRMENDSAKRIHLDNMPVGASGRFFTP